MELNDVQLHDFPLYSEKRKVPLPPNERLIFKIEINFSRLM